MTLCVSSNILKKLSFFIMCQFFFAGFFGGVGFLLQAIKPGRRNSLVCMFKQSTICCKIHCAGVIKKKTLKIFLINLPILLGFFYFEKQLLITRTMLIQNRS